MYKSPESFADGKGLKLPAGDTNESPSTILSLPTISPKIPLCYAQGIEHSVITLARYLAHANILTAEDRTSTGLLSEIISKVLKREIDKYTGEMNQFKLEYQFATRECQLVSTYGSNDEKEEILFIISLGSDPTLKISAAIAQLNQVHPDLGQTIYAVLEKASVPSMGILTFQNCVDRFGYDLRILSDPGEIEEYEEEDIPYRSQEEIDALAAKFDIPWISSAEPVISPYEVSQIAEHNRTPKLVKQCIEASLELANAYHEAQAYRGSSSGMSLGYSIDTSTIFSLGAVEFYDQDPTHQLMDDVCEEANNCYDNYTENLHEEFIPLSTEKEFLARWKGICLGLTLVSKLDKLFDALAQFNRTDNE